MPRRPDVVWVKGPGPGPGVLSLFCARFSCASSWRFCAAKKCACEDVSGYERLIAGLVALKLALELLLGPGLPAWTGRAAAASRLSVSVYRTSI